MTVSQALRRAEGLLLAAGVPDAGADSAWLLCHVTGCGRGELLLKGGSELCSDDESAFFSLIGRRCERVPLQRLTGKAYLMGIEFIVCNDVLIPRQDTEILCEKAIASINENAYKSALDLCAGSGAIGLCIAKMTRAAVTLSDISDACITAIGINAANIGASVEVSQGDLFAAVSGRSFDVVTCNPPYIPVGDRELLQAEVRHDPELALLSGADGLDCIRRIALEAHRHINAGGRLFLEFGDGQSAAVISLFPGRDVKVHRDMQGLERVAEISF